jgi:uncharacterized repeat protein (TIGR03943 family)
VKVDGTRALRAIGLVAWAAFFDYLWLSGRSVDYVGPRTTWVVGFGAISLTLASILYVSGLFKDVERTRPTAKELGRLVIIVSPIALAATAPSVTLGAQAVNQKRTADGATSLARLEAYDGSIRLYELAAAAYNPQWAAERGIDAGLQVEFDGFVSKARGEDGTIEVSRFLASCCAADAIPYSVDVVLADGAPRVEKNQWLVVRGEVTEQADGERAFKVVADEIEPIERPADAYGT